MMISATPAPTDVDKRVSISTSALIWHSVSATGWWPKPLSSAPEIPSWGQTGGLVSSGNARDLQRSNFRYYQRECADLEDWQRIAKGKTAPLLIAPIKGAAIAAGLNTEQNEKLNTELQCLEKLVGFCGLAYQGRNDIDDIIPSSRRSSDLDGRKPNLVVSLFAQQGPSADEFNLWYQSDDLSKLSHWQKRIATSDVILQANQSVDYWLLQAELLVLSVPPQLQSVTAGLVASVKKMTTNTHLIKHQGQIA